MPDSHICVVSQIAPEALAAKQLQRTLATSPLDQWRASSSGVEGWGLAMVAPFGANGVQGRQFAEFKGNEGRGRAPRPPPPATCALAPVQCQA